MTNQTPDRFRGLGALLVSVFFSSLYGIFSRYIGLSFGIFAQNWIRNLIVFIFLVIYFLLTKEKWQRFRKADIGWLLGLLLIGWFQNIFYFLAFNNLTIGTVYFLFYTMMVITGYVSGKIFFGEKLNMIKIVSIVLALTGLLLTFPVDIRAGKYLYILLSLTVGVSTTLWYVFAKKISRHYHNLQLVQLDAVTTFITSLIGAIVIGEAFPLNALALSWMMVILYAVAQIGGLFLAIYAFQKLEVQITSAVMPMEIVFALFMSYVLFRESLSIQAIIGAVFIISAAVLPSVYTIKRRT